MKTSVNISLPPRSTREDMCVPWKVEVQPCATKRAARSTTVRQISNMLQIKSTHQEGLVVGHVHHIPVGGGQVLATSDLRSTGHAMYPISCGACTKEPMLADHTNHTPLPGKTARWTPWPTHCSPSAAPGACGERGEAGLCAILCGAHQPCNPCCVHVWQARCCVLALLVVTRRTIPQHPTRPACRRAAAHAMGLSVCEPCCEIWCESCCELGCEPWCELTCTCPAP